MRAVSAIISVKPEHIEEFTQFALNHAANSKKEEGCLAFDVFMASEEAGKFYFHERYKDQAAIETHKNMPHYLLFSEKVGQWAMDVDISVWRPVSA